jgi:hypothetical protein
MPKEILRNSETAALVIVAYLEKTVRRLQRAGETLKVKYRARVPVLDPIFDFYT